MYIFVECWKARPDWLAFTPAGRGSYMAEPGKGIAELMKSGVEIVFWSMNDPGISNRGSYDSFAVWKFPTKDLADGFEQIVSPASFRVFFPPTDGTKKLDLFASFNCAEGFTGGDRND